MRSIHWTSPKNRAVLRGLFCCYFLCICDTCITMIRETCILCESTHKKGPLYLTIIFLLTLKSVPCGLKSLRFLRTSWRVTFKSVQDIFVVVSLEMDQTGIVSLAIGSLKTAHVELCQVDHSRTFPKTLSHTYSSCCQNILRLHIKIGLTKQFSSLDSLDGSISFTLQSMC